MKYLLIIGLFTMSFTACKKEPSEKAFLYGRLIDQCNGKPVSGQTVQFYRNFKEGATFLEQDTETKLLEEVITDDNGYFYFSGDNYTSNSTASYSNSSVRLQKSTYLASGHLGKGKGATEGEGIFIHNIGDVLLDGMYVNASFRIATGGYDSVKVFSSFYNINIILQTIQNNYFIGEIPQQKLSIKNFWGDENDSKYNLYIRFEFYHNSGQTTEPVYRDYFIDQCNNAIDIVYEH